MQIAQLLSKKNSLAMLANQSHMTTFKFIS
jgi:SAM-dependent MidA family methyltransferase